MSIAGKLRRRGVLGVFAKLSTWYWRVKSRLYYAPQFEAFGRGVTIRKPILILNPRGIAIGGNTFIRDGARLEVVDRPGEAPGRLSIGRNVDIEQNVHIVACSEVVIGDDCCITAGCSIVDATHPFDVPIGTNRASVLSPGESHVRIGAGVFIGIGSTVLPGVTIGDHAYIGAGSVVTHDIPADAVALGAPARVIRIVQPLSADE